ncbi:aminotransferase class V-fold PLP-dependent enzyme [Dyadobacter sp. CY326]|uniref:aminotransferase class V-fold PLP-dependent enzyme n=1 Tax=Dyadobacter sp. CY326 TaxID=2907300 RepID=UPI001F258484|nr:aminotransferase class V-fold PLP-dependent enzyme [Dyadobacter sp. CY326]MCE7066770.1 aminotransferase class V-fold PLP-dependent enzyme [Dyadobacter sp. CY326]
MITFYPGPSKVYHEVGQYLQEAVESGIISANHRSAGFMQMLEHAITGLKTKLNVPDEYEVYFVSSATECWEIIAENLISEGSLHIYNGAFGEKWMEYTQKLTGSARSFEFQTNETPVLNADIQVSANDVICVTHNETSNGTALSSAFLSTLRANFDNIIAVDATSSMAGVMLPWQSADVWYGSVQKCFGLPAGMGVMIVSPKAVERALAIGNRSHYNSLLFIRDNFLKFQTPYTPNTLGIYLMDRVMDQVAPIEHIAQETRERAQDWYSFLPQNCYALLVENESVRSETVVAVQDSKERIAAIKKAAFQEGIVLGNGYGKDKETSFRIANFPAITKNEIKTLKEFLLSFTSK